MIEFDVDMGYLLEEGELDKVVLNDENGEHEPMMYWLGGGECEVISHYYYDDYDLHEFELSCGHSYTMHDDMPYPFCPICGKKVKAVKR